MLLGFFFYIKACDSRSSPLPKFQEECVVCFHGLTLMEFLQRKCEHFLKLAFTIIEALHVNIYHTDLF